jgi:hypothetical protein
MKRVVWVVLAVLVPGAARAADFNPQPEPPAFGMVGLARTQTAVLSVVVTPVPDDGAPPPDPDDSRRCRMVLSFVGGNGEAFHDAAGNEVSRLVTLRGRAAASLTLRAQDVLTGTQLRTPIRPVLAPPPDDSVPSDCRRLVATLEIVGPLGATQILYSPPPDDQAPPPDDNLSGRTGR